MKKIIVWGTGGIYAMRRKELQELVSLNKIEIVALVNQDKDVKYIDGYPVISKEEIKNFDYEKILIAAHAGAIESILSDAEELGIDKACIENIEKYLVRKLITSKCYEKNIEHQIAIIKQILNASDEQINDYHWMFHAISQYGVMCFRNYWSKYESVNWTQDGLLQIVEEFAEFCCFIGNLKVDTAIEIGVFRGRSSYFICALLARKNPALKYTMVDIYDNLDSFEKFQEILPALDKRIPTTSEDYNGQEYDFVFIDADHSYDASIKDYYNVGQYAKKIVVFHDIYAHEYDEFNGGTVRTWKEVLALNKGKEYRVFSAYPDEWMGIGCIMK